MVMRQGAELSWIMAIPWMPNTRSGKQIYSVFKVSVNSQAQNHRLNSLTFNKTNTTLVLQQPSYKDINANATKLFSVWRVFFSVTPVQSARAVSLVAWSKLRKWALPGQGGLRDTGHCQQTLMFLCVTWAEERRLLHIRWHYEFMDHLFRTAWRLSGDMFFSELLRNMSPSNFQKLHTSGIEKCFFFHMTICS